MQKKVFFLKYQKEILILMEFFLGTNANGKILNFNGERLIIC